MGDAPIGLAPASFQGGLDSEYDGGPGDFVGGGPGDFVGGGPAPPQAKGLIASGPDKPALENAARVSFKTFGPICAKCTLG